jgi:hypothetical protein
MKKLLSFIIIALVALITFSTNVQAAEISGEEGLEAIFNETEETVKLLNDITVNNEIKVTNKKVLDLNGKTLTLNKNLVVDGGELTVTGNGKITTSVADPLISVKSGSSLILENGIFESTTYYGATLQIFGDTVADNLKTKVTIGKDAKVSGNYAVLISQNSSNAAYGVELDVYGKVTGITGNNGWEDGSFAIYTNGNIQTTTGNVPTINIYPSAVLVACAGKTGNANKDSAPAIFAAGYANWNITGGTFTGTEALSIKSGNFNITGGTFNANGLFVKSPEPNGNGTEATGSAISITSNSGYSRKIDINIDNAQVTSENGYAVFEAITNAQESSLKSIKILNGEFSGKEGAISVENTNNIGKFIEGGLFSSDVQEYTVDTLASVKEGEVFYIGKVNDIIIKETKNGTVKVNMEKAINGQTVEMSIIPESGYEIDSIKVYDDKNNKIEVKDNKFIMPDSKAYVEVEFKAVALVGEKDDTPKTGCFDISLYVCMSIMVVSLLGIVVVKKTSIFNR